MTVGKKIESEDYNRIRNKATSVLGTGGTDPNSGSPNPSYGYGQPIRSMPVADGDKISKAEWDNLRWDIYNALYHQTATVPSIQIITANSKIQSTILNYETLANTAVSNRFTVANDNLAPEGGTPSTGATTSRNFGWTSLATCTVTVNFSNSTIARYFFNAGGKIRFSSSFVKTLNNSQNIAWETLLSSYGTQDFGGNTFYTLTSSFSTWYTSPPLSTPYGALSYQLQASVNVASNSNGTATQIIFRIRWVDNYTDPGPPDPGDLVQGTLSLTASQLRPIGSLEPDGTSFNVTGPASYSISGIT